MQSDCRLCRALPCHKKWLPADHVPAGPVGSCFPCRARNFKTAPSANCRAPPRPAPPRNEWRPRDRGRPMAADGWPAPRVPARPAGFLWQAPALAGFLANRFVLSVKRVNICCSPSRPSRHLARGGRACGGAAREWMPAAARRCPLSQRAHRWCQAWRLPGHTASKQRALFPVALGARVSVVVPIVNWRANNAVRRHS